MPIKGKKINLNFLEKINFYHCCELITTEYAEYQKLYESAVHGSP